MAGMDVLVRMMDKRRLLWTRCLLGSLLGSGKCAGRRAVPTDGCRLARARVVIGYFSQDKVERLLLAGPKLKDGKVSGCSF